MTDLCVERIQLSMRQYSIIQTLKANIVPMKSAALYSRLGISQRLLRYEISEINRLAKRKYILSGDNGYSIDLDCPGGEPFQDVTLDDFAISSTRLVLYVLRHGKVSIFDLEDAFFTSESVIIKMLGAYKEDFARFHIAVKRKGQFVFPEGNEMDIRKYIAEIIYSEGFNDQSISQNQHNDYAAVCEEVHRILDQAALDRGVTVKPVYHRTTVLMIGISLLRIVEGHTSSACVPEEPPDEQGRLQMGLLREVLNRAGEQYAIQISDCECTNIYRLLQGILIFEDSAGSAAPIADGAFVRSVEHIVDATFRHFGVQASFAPLLERFATHVHYLLIRSKSKVFNKAGFSGNLRYSNPFLYEMSIHLAHQLSNAFEIDINEDEIGLIGIYLGTAMANESISIKKARVILVCPPYHNMGEQLASQLTMMFNSITFIRIVRNYNEILHDEKYDFILSTLDNDKSFKDIVYINPVVTAQDYEAINTKLTLFRAKSRADEMKLLLQSYADPQLFFLSEDLSSGRDIIDFLVDRLRELDIVPEQFRKSVFQRERQASTAFFDSFAIPHALDVDAYQNKIAIYYSGKKIDWFGYKVNLVILFASKGYNAEAGKLYEFLFEILLKGELLTDMQTCKSYEEFMEKIMDRLYKLTG